MNNLHTILHIKNAQANQIYNIYYTIYEVVIEVNSSGEYIIHNSRSGKNLKALSLYKVKALISLSLLIIYLLSYP